MTAPHIPKSIYNKLNLYEFINADKLPGLSKDYLNGRNKNDYSYLSDFELLRKALLKCKCSNGKEEYYKCLFLAVVNYYLYNYPESLEFIDELENISIEDKPNAPILLNFILTLKYKMIKLDKIILLVSGDYTKSKGFNILEKKINYRKKRINVQPIFNFNENKFKFTVLEFEQIFIFAHGDEEGLTLGTNELKDITPAYFNDLLEMRKTKLPVLGLFSCGNAFNTERIKGLTDYFITDNEAAYSDFAELFIFGYLRNYLKTLDIIPSVEFGLNIPVIRTGSKTTIELYELGNPIKG